MKATIETRPAPAQRRGGMVATPGNPAGWAPMMGAMGGGAPGGAPGSGGMLSSLFGRRPGAEPGGMGFGDVLGQLLSYFKQRGGAGGAPGGMA